MKTTFSRFLFDECGATAMEYGLIAAFISIAIISAFASLGTGLPEIFTAIGSKFTTESAKIQ